MSGISQQAKIVINSFIAFAGMGFATIQPFLVGTIVDTFHFDRNMVGWISSISIFGMVAGGIIATALNGRFSLVKMLHISLVGLIFFDLLSIYMSNPTTMLIVRFISGIFGGLIYANALSIFSGLKNAIKAFGVYVLMYCLSASIVLVIYPYMVRSWGLVGGFSVLIIMSFLALVGSFLIKDLERPKTEHTFVALSVLLRNKEVLIGLLAYFAMQLGGGITWTYCERIGKEALLSPDFIGVALGVSTMASLGSGVFVMRLGDSFGFKKPILWGSWALIAGMLLLWFANIPLVYIFSLTMFGTSWAFLMPFYQQIQSKFDGSGKVVSLGTIVNMLGRATGPAIAAMALGANAFVNVIWIGVIAVLLSLVSVFWLFKHSDVV